jgi:hypothetical protein
VAPASRKRQFSHEELNRSKLYSGQLHSLEDNQNDLCGGNQTEKNGVCKQTDILAASSTLECGHVSRWLADKLEATSGIMDGCV